MKELTVAIQDEYEWKVIYRTKLYTEEEYKELENELEYVRTIKDSAEETLKEVREENKKLKERIDELEQTDEQLAKKLKSVVSGDNEQMHADADQLLSDFLRAIWYNKSADQYDEMSKDFRYA